MEPKPDYRSLANAAADEMALFRLVFEIFHIQNDIEYVAAGALAGWRITEITDQALPAAFQSVLRGKIAAALKNLERRQLVAHDEDDDVSLTEKGFFAGQDMFIAAPEGPVGSENSLSEKSTIPASDRFVTLSDNQKEVQEARAAILDLADKIRGANDFCADPEERLFVLREVDALREALHSSRVRVAALWQATQETGALQFVAKEAAGGVVGAAAVAAIVTLLALIGILA